MRQRSHPHFYFQRKGSFNPRDIAGLQLWLDGSLASTLYQDSAKTTPVTSDGDVVGAWEDKSGNGNDATQEIAANKPLYKTEIQNGLSILRFDGTDYFDADGVESVMSGSDKPVSVFAVLNRDNTDSRDAIIGFGNTDADPFFEVRTTGSDDGVAPDKLRLQKRDDLDVLLTQDGGTIGNSCVMLSILVAGTSVDAYKNGTQIITGANLDVGATTLNQTSIGANPVQASRFLPPDSDIAEILVYDSVLSAKNRSTVETYLNNKWAVY